MPNMVIFVDFAKRYAPGKAIRWVEELATAVPKNAALRIRNPKGKID